jgi:hypothetical protein
MVRTGVDAPANQLAVEIGDMKLSFWIWEAPHLWLVLHCLGCRRADVRLRWPERFANCPRCGRIAHSSRRPLT